MSELTDRLRTCVAHLTTIEISQIMTDDQFEAIIDAKRLLTEAADELEKPIDVRLGPPMEVIRAVAAAPIEKPLQLLPATWYDSGPIEHVPSRNACPKCDSRAAKTVRRAKGNFTLECPVCGHTWKR